MSRIIVRSETFQTTLVHDGILPAGRAGTPWHVLPPCRHQARLTSYASNAFAVNRQ